MAGHDDWPNKFEFSHGSFLTGQNAENRHYKLLIGVQKAAELNCQMASHLDSLNS